MTTTVATRSLAECEGAIERGRVGIIEAATALREIRDNRLYKEAGYKSFDPYCQERLGFTRARADQIIAAGETAEKLPTNVGGFIPEAQARELAPLKDDPPAMAEVMAEASANGSKPTAKAVKAAVQKRVAPKYDDCEGCSNPADPVKKGNVTADGGVWHGKCWDWHTRPVPDAAKAAPAVAAIDAILTDADTGATDAEPDALADAEVVEAPPQPDDGKPVAFSDVVIRVVGGADRALKPIRISLAATRDADTIANVIRVAVATELLANPLKIATKGKP